MSETCTCVSTSEVTISSISRASIRSAACAAPSRGRRRHSSGGRRLLTCTFGKSTKNPPSSPTRFRTFAVFVWVDMAVTRTWLAVRPPRWRRPNRHRQPDAEATARRRSPGRRKSFEAGSDGSAGAPIPGTSREAQVTETTRDRNARGQTTQDACERGRQWETARQPTAFGPAPARRLRWQAMATSEGDERGHEHKSFDGGPYRLSRRRSEREGCGSRVTRRVWRGAAGTPRPLLVHGSAGRPNRGEPSGRGRGVPGTLLHFGSPRSTRVRLRSPVQDLWREVRESLPPRG
jgi:hypothetical protein